MIRNVKVKEYIKAVNYKIQEGYDYLWNCFGDNCYSFEYFEGDNFSCSCIFDREKSNVYCLEFWNYKTDQYYRWIDSNKLDAYKNECTKRNVKFEEAIDGRPFIVSDSKTILSLIKSNFTANDKETIEIDLSEEETFQLMKRAHELDITFNELVEDILWEAIEKYGSDVETKKSKKVPAKGKRSKEAREGSKK